MNDITQLFSDFIGLNEKTPPLPEIIFALVLSFVLMCVIAFIYKCTYRGAD